jgi:murein L,D-transpeptidase YcbB/YkuD
LKPGVIDAQIGGLRRRLNLTRDLRTGDLQSPVFDAALEDAVRHFQARNGLAVDGVVGRETRAALNVPAEVGAATIAHNLFHYPNVLARQIGTAIVVNVPGAELRFFRDGELSFSRRVIVGRADWPTPIISDAISAIEVNPYWNIPPRIAKIEVIPRIIKDPEYLKARSIRVLSVGGKSPRELDPANIDWTSAGTGSLPFRLRQDPGPQNPMGVVKFRLSNPDHVFLHDTPTQQLFERAKRSLSHGCVRVQDALQLAKLILEARSDMSPNGLEQALEGGAPVTIRLREPVPVHLVAISAWVDADGAVQFRHDPTRDLAEKSCIASLNTVAGNL